MYIDSEDFKTVWDLGHKWTGCDAETTDPKNLPQDLKTCIQRMLAAILRNNLPARGKKLAILLDDSFLTFLFDFRHIYRIYKCIHNDIFDKEYLKSIYVRRTNVLDWCKKEYLEPPPIWKVGLENGLVANKAYDASDDENENWYNDLTDRRKQRVACLEMAKKLWLINPEQSYEEIFNHTTMKQFGNPGVFSFEAFKKWARPFAPEQIKEGGRPIKNK